MKRAIIKPSRYRKVNGSPIKAKKYWMLRDIKSVAVDPPPPVKKENSGMTALMPMPSSMAPRKPKATRDVMWHRYLPKVAKRVRKVRSITYCAMAPALPFCGLRPALGGRRSLPRYYREREYDKKIFLLDSVRLFLGGKKLLVNLFSRPEAYEGQGYVLSAAAPDDLAGEPHNRALLHFEHENLSAAHELRRVENEADRLGYLPKVTHGPLIGY